MLKQRRVYQPVHIYSLLLLMPYFVYRTKFKIDYDQSCRDVYISDASAALEKIVLSQTLNNAHAPLFFVWHYIFREVSNQCIDDK